MWYYKIGEQIFGPLQPQELRQVASQGIIIATTPVRQGEDGAWRAASSVRGLLIPPPLPPPTLTPMPPVDIIDVVIEELQASPQPPPTPQTRRQYTAVVDEDTVFFDFGFTQFLTPVIIQIFWVIEVILACLAPFVVSIYIFFYNPVAVIDHWPLERQLMISIFYFVLCTIFCALYLVLSRVCHEVLIVIFKIEEHTRTIREKRT